VTAPPLVSLSGIGKRYPGVVALDGVDLELRAGEVHALVGENGAGKSTLVRILTGAHQPETGEIRLDGVPVRFADPRAAQRAGVAAIHQELTRVPEMSVAENLFLAREPRGFLGVDRRAMRARSKAALARVGLDLDVDRPLGSFPPPVQQLAAIARAIDLESRVLVLDEPTASLDRAEAERFLRKLRDLAQGGLAVVLVGHRLDEILSASDRIAVLRGGRKVAELERGKATRLGLVEAMLGRGLAEIPHRTRDARGAREPVLEARSVAGPGLDAPFDLELAAGEVLGLAGLLGSGRSELLRLLAGVERRTDGSVRVGGEPLPPGDVRAAVDRGLVLSPEERQADGILPGLSVRENVAVARARGFGRCSRSEQSALASSLARRLGIACADLEQEAGSLSGGNLQKVLLARWLALEPRVLLLDEPTRGVDVGGKREIEAAILELAGAGLAAAVASSELEEVRALSDRAIALHGRRVVSEHRGEDLAEDRLLRAIAGEAPSA
jgi:monosaccharide-transporting ATPase